MDKERHRLIDGQLDLFDPSNTVRRCKACGRRIRARQSLEAGIGRTCRAKLKKRKRRRPAKRKRPGAPPPPSAATTTGE